MREELIIRISTDSDGNEVSLENMRPETAQSLVSFISALSELAKTYPNQNLAISLRNGSIIAALPTPSTTIRKDIIDIVEGKSSDKERVKILKHIQKRIKENGLAYSVRIKGTNEIDLTSRFNGKQFTTRRTLHEWTEEILFIKGEMFLAGGDSTTNVHIRNDDRKYTVHCDQTAHVFKKPVYSHVCVSILRKFCEGADEHFTLIDTYADDKTYLEFMMLYRRVTSSKDLDRFDMLHEEICKCYNNQNYLGIIKIMRLFNHRRANRGLIRSVLMSVSPIQEAHEGIKELFDSMVSILKRKK